MELPKTTEARIQCIRDAAARLGGNAALGRALGYRDGAFVGQMLRGERPVTEKTLLAMSKVHQLAGLFGTPHPTQPPSQAPVAKLDIGETVARLGELLGRADPKTRDTVAQLLLRYAQDPADGARIAQAIELLLRGCSEDDPATEP